MTTQNEKVIALLEKKQGPMTVQQMQNILDIPEKNLYVVLFRLKNQKILQKDPTNLLWALTPHYKHYVNNKLPIKVQPEYIRPMLDMIRFFKKMYPNYKFMKKIKEMEESL